MVIKAGPVIFPAIRGVQDGLAAGPQAGFNTFVFEASGYNPNAGQVDMGKVQEVVVRDVAMVAIGFLLSAVARRI